MTITTNKPKLYIKISATGSCRNKISNIIKHLNYNFQLKKIFQNEIKRFGKFQRTKQPQEELKHVKTHPIRFKRGK